MKHERITALSTKARIRCSDNFPEGLEMIEYKSVPDGPAVYFDGLCRLLDEVMQRNSRKKLLLTHNVNKGRRKSLSVEHLKGASMACNDRPCRRRTIPLSYFTSVFQPL